mgnify:CR=1 FL=1
MTNITRMPWMKEDYTATKRAFKKKLGLFDKDVAIEELQEQIRIEGDHEQRLLEEASENKNTMAWKDAVRTIQMLVFDHCNNAVGQSDDWAKSNEEIKQAWERILQG